MSLSMQPLFLQILRCSLLLALFTITRASGTLEQVNSTASFLNLTAITGVNGASALECWQLGPFATSSVPGTSGTLSLFLGDMANATYTVLPPRFDGGLHNAPAVQLVLFTAGLAHVTLPHSSDEAWIQGGKYGLIVAADTPDVSEDGHFTEYPGDSDTVALQVPFKDGEKLEHQVLHDGACSWDEMLLP